MASLRREAAPGDVHLHEEEFDNGTVDVCMNRQLDSAGHHRAFAFRTWCERTKRTPPSSTQPTIEINSLLRRNGVHLRTGTRHSVGTHGFWPSSATLWIPRVMAHFDAPCPSVPLVGAHGAFPQNGPRDKASGFRQT